MTDDRYLDLDAALEEVDAASKPVTVRLFRRDWELPGSPSAAVMIRVARMYEAGKIDAQGGLSREVEAAEAALLIADLVPRPTLEEWYALGLSAEHLLVVVPRVMSLYKDRKGGVFGMGEAPAPTGASASATSSPAGPSSRPTSSASTGSTSSPS